MPKPENELVPYWPKFVKSPEFQDVAYYPEEDVKSAFTHIGEFMGMVTSKSLRDWDGDDLFAILGPLASTADDLDNSNSEEDDAAFIVSYDTLRALLQYLSRTNQLGINPDDLGVELASFEAATGMEGPGLDFTTPRDDGLPAWQERTSQDIKAYTSDWLAAYVKSAAWQKRSKGVNTDLLGLVLETLVDQAYGEYRKTPKSWTKYAITGVMTGYFVSNLDLMPAEYSLIAPALNGLLAFVGENGWLNAKKAATYQRYVTAAAPEMIAKAQDGWHFGPSKLLLQGLREADIDPSDNTAVQAYMADLNRAGGVDRLYAEQAVSADGLDKLLDELHAEYDFSTDPASLTDTVEAFLRKEDRMKLLQNHQSQVDGHHWRRLTAFKVHSQGIKLALQLWAQRETYPVMPSWHSSDAIEALSDVADTLYAQHIQKPADWTAPVIRQYSQWLCEEKPGGYIERLEGLISLFAMMADQKIFPAKRAEALTRVVRAELPTWNKKAKVKGKVISMKQAKKLLKHHQKK
ncbi:hypothetical protein [Levilactobacillus lindianensis]|uniref:hypothetical protein n=1 Tax=Levilactobacillus lindianensis TaxID=2486018 RepID=UPI000F74ABB2|nr:hypothetical protein [Levilactobacillus lindianensis]